MPLKVTMIKSNNPWNKTGTIITEGDSNGERVLNMVLAEIEYFTFINGKPYIPKEVTEYWKNVTHYWEFERKKTII